MAILLAALGVFIHARFAIELDDGIQQRLETQSQELRDQLRRSGEPAREAARRVLVRQEDSLTQLLAPGGRVIAENHPVRGPLLNAGERARAARRPATVDRREPVGFPDPVRLRGIPVAVGGDRLIVVVGEPLDDRDEALSRLLGVLLVGGPIGLLLASLAGYVATGAALRPVEAIRRRAAAISSAGPGERVPLPRARDELYRLGETLNAMLARLEASLERERRFVDDASHELRTPLALHRTELELALRYGGDADQLRAAIVSAAEEADRLIQLAEDLLVVARTEKGELDLEIRPIELERLLGDLGERFRLRATEAGRALVLDAPEGLRVDGDRLRVEQALTNMIDNALRHGAGEVRLFTREADDRLEIHVIDEGAGFPPGFVEQAFERFTRADAARGRGGTGLGLAIVAGIARSHGGAARAENRADGGADVWIELPRK